MNNWQSDLILEDRGGGGGRGWDGGGLRGGVSFICSDIVSYLPVPLPPSLSLLPHEFYSEERNADESDCRFAASEREAEKQLRCGGVMGGGEAG